MRRHEGFELCIKTENAKSHFLFVESGVRLLQYEDTLKYFFFRKFSELY